jgi:hypothetical protein
MPKVEAFVCFGTLVDKLIMGFSFLQDNCPEFKCTWCVLSLIIHLQHPSWNLTSWPIETNAPCCTHSLLLGMKFNDVQQMIWGKLQYIVHTQPHLTSIFLQTHAFRSSCEGNIHVFKMSNLLDPSNANGWWWCHFRV